MYGKNKQKVCAMCFQEFFPIGRNQIYCGSSKQKTGCSAIRQRQWTYNTPSRRNGRKARNFLPARPHLIQSLGGKCRLCGTLENLSINHIRPVSAGGSDELENLEVLCRSCNIQEYHRLYITALKYYFDTKKA